VTNATDNLSNTMEKIIFFDGKCGLCSRIVTFLLDRKSGSTFKFASLQSQVATSLVPEHAVSSNSNLDPKTVVFYRHELTLIRSEAVEAIMIDLGGFYKIVAGLGKIIPLILKNAIYDFIAKNRYSWFGKTEACYPSPESQKTFSSTD